jgi:L-fuconolactonase
MEIIDLQLHELAPFLPWQGASDEVRRDVLTETLENSLDSVGVDGVVLFPAQGLELSQHLAERAPDRFASVVSLVGSGPDAITDDPEAPDVGERIAEMYRRPGVVGIRFSPSPHFRPDEYVRWKAGGYDRALAACEQQGIPAFVMISGVPKDLAAVAERYPDLQIVLDHLGIPQRPLEQADDPPWKVLPDVLDLARYPNVGLKLCGAPALSEEGYPFADVWPYVAQLLDSFGVDRVAWASDIGRFRGRIGWDMRFPVAQAKYVGKHTYMEALAFILYSPELSATEKEKLLGQSARRMLKWPLGPGGER